MRHCCFCCMRSQSEFRSRTSHSAGLLLLRTCFFSVYLRDNHCMSNRREMSQINEIYSSTFAALDTAASSATSPDLLVPASEAAGVASFASIVAWGTVATSSSGTTLAEDAVSRATGASALPDCSCCTISERGGVIFENNFECIHNWTASTLWAVRRINSNHSCTQNT
jgi:hypothetical protein